MSTAARVFRASRRLSGLAAIGLALFAAIDCGETSVIPSGLTCDGGAVPPVGRPVAEACSSSAVQGVESVACATASDCQDAGGATACLGGTCAFDQCLVDSDCAAGQLCACSTQFHTQVRRFNRCIATGCRVDADCAGGQSCSPSYDSYCGSLIGYDCHSAADTCTTDATCCSSGIPSAQCAYAPELGHFACKQRTTCGG